MVEMGVTRIGSYRKKGNYVEVKLEQDSSYDQVAFSGVQALNVDEPISEDEDYNMRNGPLTLFGADGTVIRNEPVDTNFGPKSWTIGLYLNQFRKTPAQLKIGVGYLCLVSIIYCAYSNFISINPFPAFAVI